MRTSRLATVLTLHLIATIVAVIVCGSGFARDTAELKKRASWTQLDANQVKARIDAWLTDAKADDAAKERATKAWSAVDEKQSGDAALLDRVVAVIAAVDAEANKFVTALQSQSPNSLADHGLLFKDSTNEFIRHQLRLAYGRWLAQHSHFDEALEQLSGLKPEQVVDPAALLFYQAVAYHRLLKKEECLAALDKLLENEVELPKRFATVAKLMDADIRPLETDSLDEVARMMSDIRRRLNFGHAGKRVRKEEDDVIAKLDKMIKDIEEKMQKAPSTAPGQGSTQPSNPAQDSQNLGGKGQGDVDQKRIGSKSGWGNLPPKEREQALQQISKDLPAHYREAIEEYFRKLAREGEK